MNSGLFETMFDAIAKGFTIWDSYNKTKYAREYEKLIKAIADEEAKPIYERVPNTPDRDLRDQAKLDRYFLDLKILLERFLVDEGEKK